jgi:glycosyltransferase involved in cell wall biosynthesis
VYAGVGSFADEVTAGGLGIAVPWDPDQVAEALTRMLNEASTDPVAHQEHRRAIAAYAAHEYDMSAAAARLADHVEELGARRLRRTG